MFFVFLLQFTMGWWSSEAHLFSATTVVLVFLLSSCTSSATNFSLTKSPALLHPSSSVLSEQLTDSDEESQGYDFSLSPVYDLRLSGTSVPVSDDIIGDLSKRGQPPWQYMLGASGKRQTQQVRIVGLRAMIRNHDWCERLQQYL